MTEILHSNQAEKFLVVARSISLSRCGGLQLAGVAHFIFKFAPQALKDIYMRMLDHWSLHTRLCQVWQAGWHRQRSLRGQMPSHTISKCRVSCPLVAEARLRQTQEGTRNDNSKDCRVQGTSWHLSLPGLWQIGVPIADDEFSSRGLGGVCWGCSVGLLLVVRGSESLASFSSPVVSGNIH